MSFYFPIPEQIKKETKGKKKIYDCELCELSTKVKHPKMDIYGNTGSGLVIVGNNDIDDERGLPFVNKEGELFRSILLRNKINMKKHCAVINAISCYSHKIDEQQRKCCRPILKEKLEQLKPKLIIAVGGNAVSSVLNLKEKESIINLRNRIIPNYEFNCLVFPVFHPDDVSRSREKEQSLKWDMKRILNLWHKDFHNRRKIDSILKERKILDGINIFEISTIKELRYALNKCEEHGSFAFDYETSNLKPYDDKFFVQCFGIGFEKTAWVLYYPDFKEDINKAKWLLFKYLNNPEIKKFIQHAKYEETVTKYTMNYNKMLQNFFDGNNNYISPIGTIIRNYFDPMLATHVIDQRGGCTSLDFQNLVRFGIPPYSGVTKKYLITDKKKNEKQNKILDCPKEDLIKYQGLDVITTYYNSKVLDDILLDTSPKFRWCNNFLQEGHDVFSIMSWNGFPIRPERVEYFDQHLKKIEEELYNEIMDMKEVKGFIKWMESNGCETKPKKAKVTKEVDEEKRAKVKKVLLEYKRRITL